MYYMNPITGFYIWWAICWLLVNYTKVTAINQFQLHLLIWKGKSIVYVVALNRFWFLTHRVYNLLWTNVWWFGYYIYSPNVEGNTLEFCKNLENCRQLVKETIELGIISWLCFIPLRYFQKGEGGPSWVK